jgi:uncharacterized protein (TIGR02145 family)
VSSVFAQITITFGVVGNINGNPATINDLTSVKVKNISQGTSLSLNSTDILCLNATIDIKTISSNKGIQIAPNPINNKGELRFYSPNIGITRITITDALGKIVIEQDDNLYIGNYSYSLVGLPSGIYFANIIGTDYFYNASIISIGNDNQSISLNQINATQTSKDTVNETQITSKLKSLKAQTKVNYLYTVGDSLVVTGYFNGQVYSVRCVPTKSGQITFPAYGIVKDQDSNVYNTIYLSSVGLTFMAQNLKAIHYNDGSSIPNLTDYKAWNSTIAGAYCSYNNTKNIDSINANGLLYNLYTANTGKLCPNGWQIPYYDDFFNFVWSTDDRTANAFASTSGWTIDELQYNQMFNNLSGFTATPSGYRDGDGSFSSLHSDFTMWYKTGNISINSGSSNYSICNCFSPNYGTSVRCVHY